MSRRGFSSASHRNEAARVCESSSKGHLWGNSFLLQLAFQILDFFFLSVLCMFKILYFIFNNIIFFKFHWF